MFLNTRPISLDTKSLIYNNYYYYSLYIALVYITSGYKYAPIYGGAIALALIRLTYRVLCSTAYIFHFFSG